MKNSVWTVCNKKGDFSGTAKKYHISPMLARLMVNRDICTEEQIGEYLDGDLSLLNDPHLLKDMDRAVPLLSETIRQGEKLCIIGDYDIDGVCSAYILKKGIKLCAEAVGTDQTDKILVRLPDRIRDGYGMNDAMVDEAETFGASLIITCDNGIAADSQIKRAKEKGLSVIVTDHHEVPFDLLGGEKRYRVPEADAVIDPKQADCPYPFKGICGGVVAYKLITCLFEEMGVSEDALKELLMFAAFSTVGDIMDLNGENRLIVKYGLKAMATGENPGLNALIDATGLNKSRITPYHIGFVLGPCINATGRLDLPDRALHLFEAEDEETAVRIAAELKEFNDSRKAMEQEELEKAFSLLETDTSYADETVLVVYLPDCHESLAGLIAGKLKERYNKPSLVVTKSAEGAKGSARSIEAYDMFEELSKVKELFTKFGGHKMAAGFSLPEEKVGELRKRLNENSRLTRADLTAKIQADMQLHFNGISLEFAKELERLEPYGNGNKRPLFVEDRLRIKRMEVRGKNKNVLSLAVAPESAFQNGVLSDWSQLREAVIFGDAEAIREEIEGKELKLLFEISVNEYRGSESVQLTVLDYKY
ncbi:MAG: single-stranded-DNA-specific exonuclease RecJ [Lachnospiraceae bacterium]|nr:single-stranded-DNA-specific exonuclease RecJ [Lachnospiraceae bacterium]